MNNTISPFVRLSIRAILLLVMISVQTTVWGDYVVTQLDFSPSTFSTVAYGISNNGIVAGQYRDPNPHGFIYQNGVYTPTNTSSSVETGKLDVNSAGETVGFRASGGQGPFGDPFHMPGSNTTAIWRINDSGQKLIKSTYAATPRSRDFIGVNAADAVQIMYPSSPAGVYSAYGLNDQGTVAGILSSSGPAQGFIFDGSNVETFLVPGSVQTWATGINSSDVVVGGFRTTPGTLLRDYEAFVYDHGTFTTLNIPGAVGAFAYDINNRGQIVGAFVGVDGQSHGFLASPVPEPTGGVWAVLATVVGLSFRRRSWRRPA